MTKDNLSGQPDHDVVIVGLGPTGATLANILGEYGLDVVVLEREAGVYPLPRAVHFDDEAMRVFQSIGLADAIGRDARVNVGTKFVDSNMELMLDWSRPQEVGPLGWHPSYRFHQPDLEAELNLGIASCETVTLRRSASVTSVADRGDVVEVSYSGYGWCKAVIANIRTRKKPYIYDIEYDDGEYEQRVIRKRIRTIGDRYVTASRQISTDHSFDTANSSFGIRLRFSFGS